MDVLSVVGLIVSVAATAVSVMAWKAAQRAAKAAERQASAAERQADEAFQSVLDSQAVALYQAQASARDSVPNVVVSLEEAYQDPCVLAPHLRASKTASRPAPETLDPLRTHRLDFLGKRFRGIIVNHDVHPVTLIADHGLFLAGISPRRPEPLGLPQAQSGMTWVLGPGQAASLEWFGACTVIDWYELARMPAADAFGGRAGVHVPYTVIAVNRSGDEQWSPPAKRIVLELDRLPVYLPGPAPTRDGAAGTELLLLGGDGRGVGCDVRYGYPRVPQAFTDLTRADFLPHASSLSPPGPPGRQNAVRASQPSTTALSPCTVTAGSETGLRRIKTSSKLAAGPARAASPLP